MSDIYVTEATFRSITSKIELPKGFKYKDTLIWELSNGGEVSFDNPVIFSDVEVKDILTYKALCQDPDLIKVTTFKKVQVQDSLRYLEPERTPCYHIDKDCQALNSDYEYTSIKIPNVFIEKFPVEERKQKVEEYRQYFKKLINEFNVKHGGNWMDIKDHKSRFAFRISAHFNIPDTDVFDRDLVDAKNSGLRVLRNDEVSYLKEEISTGFKELWEDENRKRLWREKRWLFRQSWLGNKKDDIYGDISPYTQDEVKQILRGIQRIKRGKIIDNLKHLYHVQYCPKLEYDEMFLQKLGLRPCYQCTRYGTGEVVPLSFD